MGDPAEFHLQDLSIEAWIRRGDEQKATAIGSGGFFFASDTGGYGFGLLDDGRLMLSQVGLSFVPSSRGITETTNWHHVAVTKSGTKVVFYLDGAAITSTNLAGQFVFNRPFALGGLGGQVRNIFLGDIDDLSIFSRPLSAAEITGIYDAGSRGKCRTGLAVDERSEGNLPCQIRYVIENNAVLELVFLTLPDSLLNLESSTNLMDWVPVRRLADAGGEVRNLIKTNVTLYYRCLSNP